MKKIGIVLFLCCFFSAVVGQDYSAFQRRFFVSGTDTLRYRVLYPENYDSSKAYPLIVFLHGAGHRGKDNQRQLLNGGSVFLKESNRKKFPAIVVFPQCSLNDFWARTRILRAPTDSTAFQFEYLTDVPFNKGLSLVSQLLDSMATDKHVNNKQIYIGGLSMGAMGTFEMLWRKPGFFAAAFPICGGGNPKTSTSYGKNFPIWIFHGEKDQVVSVTDSRVMVTALKNAGAKVKYTEYPGVRHDSWKKAFQEPQLLPWLFSQKKS